MKFTKISCALLAAACLMAVASPVAFGAAGDVSLTINGQAAKPGDYKPADIEELVISTGDVKIMFGKDPTRDASQENDPSENNSRGWAQRRSDDLSQALSGSAVDGVAATRRSLSGRGARDSRPSHRPHALGQIEEGGKR